MKFVGDVFTHGFINYYWQKISNVEVKMHMYLHLHTYCIPSVHPWSRIFIYSTNELVRMAIVHPLDPPRPYRLKRNKSFKISFVKDSSPEIKNTMQSQKAHYWDGRNSDENWPLVIFTCLFMYITPPEHNTVHEEHFTKTLNDAMRYTKPFAWRTS